MLRAWFVGIGVAASVAACGGDDDVECGAGTEEVDGECRPIGPDGGVDDGDGCGAGTRPDGAGGCVASALPSDQRSCIGRFGPIDEDAADTLYVDGSYTGGGSDGSAGAPYTAIQDAVDDASSGFVVAIASGTYDEDVNVDLPLAIEGRCAREVTIDGTVTITSGGTSVQGVTVTNGSPGILLRGSLPLGGDTFGTIIGTSIIEMNGGSGVSVEASSLDLDRSEVRLTQAVAASLDIAEQGSGIYVFEGSLVRVGNSIIEMNGGHGIDFADATGPLDTTIASGDSFLVGSIRSSGIIEMNIIEMNGLTGVRVSAFAIGSLPDPGSGRVSVLSNMIATNGEHGVSAQDTIVDISGNDIVNNGGSLPAEAYGVAASFVRGSITGNTLEGDNGGGVHMADSQGTVSGNAISGFPVVGIAMVGAQSGATIASNVVTGVGNVGIYVFDGTDVVVDANEVSDTQLSAGADFYESGHGVFVTGFLNVAPVFFDVRNNHIHDNAGSGITLAAITPDDETDPLYLVIGNTVERNANMGINVQQSGDGDVWSNGVHDNGRFGIRAVDTAIGSARIRLFDNFVTGTMLTAAGNDGDGIAMIESHVGIGDTLMGNNVQDAERAGILFSGSSSGFCDENQVGDIDSNGAYDILAQGEAEMLMSIGINNSLGIWDVVTDDVEREAVDVTAVTAQSVTKPL